MQYVLIPLYSSFIKRSTGVFIVCKLINQVPFFTYRVVMNVLQLLKNELFTIAILSIKAIFKYFMYLPFLCLSFLYAAMQQIE